MRAVFLSAIIGLAGLPAFAQSEAKIANCAAQVAIVSQAKALREEGRRERRATREIQRSSDPEIQKISAFVPELVRFVYNSPTDQITPEFLEQWRAACLSS